MSHYFEIDLHSNNYVVVVIDATGPDLRSQSPDNGWQTLNVDIGGTVESLSVNVKKGGLTGMRFLYISSSPATKGARASMVRQI